MLLSTSKMLNCTSTPASHWFKFHNELATFKGIYFKNSCWYPMHGCLCESESPDVIMATEPGCVTASAAC